MHRSGTSAVAGFLAKAGYFAGDESDLLPAAEDNPKGFFERADVNALNDELLAELGGAWDKPPPRDVVSRQAPQWRPRVEEVLDGLAQEAGGRPLVLKDPRISLAMPAWLPALAARFALILIDRSPLDVALSVRRRDGRPLYVALALWQLYYTELLEGLAGKRVLVVHYERFVDDPTRQGLLLDQLADVLGAATASAAGAEGFVSGDMRHNRTGLKDAATEQALTGAQLALARWMAELPEGWAELHPPKKLRAQADSALVTAAEYYDAVADRYGMETAYDMERHRALHFEQATELKDRHIENIEDALGHLRRRVEEQEERISELEADNAELRAGNNALHQELRTLHQDSRAAATNLLSAATRGWPGRSGH
jgi:hypothetical protein